MNEIVHFFNQLGISIVDANGKARDTLSILPELADAFQHISRQESLGIGQKLGLTEATILLLQSGRQAVDDLVDRQRRLGVTTKEQADIMAKFLDQWQDFKQQGEATSRSIIVSMLPAINDLLKSFENITFFLQDHKNLVTGFFIALGTAITAFALPAIKSLAVWVLTVASPFLLLAAGIGLIIAGFALLFDEIKTFQEGGDTLFGRMLEAFPKFAEANRLITLGLTKTWDILKNIFSTFMDLIGLGENDSLFKSLIDFVTGAEDEESSKTENLSPAEQVESDLEGLSPEDIENDFPKSDFDPKKHLDGNDGKLQQELRAGRMLIAQAATSPISSMTSSSISNATNSSSKEINVNVGDIIIQTTASVEDIPASVAEELKKKITSAVNFFDDGVAV